VKFDDVFDVLGGIVFIGIITAIVSSRNTAGQITAAGNAFAGSIRAALGK
jgi:hypothetical protein